VEQDAARQWRDMRGKCDGSGVGWTSRSLLIRSTKCAFQPCCPREYIPNRGCGSSYFHFRLDARRSPFREFLTLLVLLLAKHLFVNIRCSWASFPLSCAASFNAHHRPPASVLDGIGDLLLCVFPARCIAFDLVPIDWSDVLANDEHVRNAAVDSQVQGQRINQFSLFPLDLLQCLVAGFL
jgi:hypothetical protein